jgi:hypothetical protein
MSASWKTIKARFPISGPESSHSKDMKELDESFQQTVKRAVTPFKPDTSPEVPTLDVRTVSADVIVRRADMMLIRNRTPTAHSAHGSSAFGSCQTLP